MSGTSTDFVYACPLCANVVCSSQSELEEHMLSCMNKSGQAVSFSPDDEAEVVQSATIIEQQDLQEFVIQHNEQS